jgi:hypothetical protein
VYDRNAIPTDDSQLHPARNPYAPPKAHVADPAQAPRVKPRTVVWATVALWVSFGLTFTSGAIAIKDDWLSLQPMFVVVSVTITLVLLLYAALIYFVSSGRYWARLILAVLLVVGTVSDILKAPAVWQYSEGLVLMMTILHTCEFMAMYWLFTEPGRRWFKR